MRTWRFIRTARCSGAALIAIFVIVAAPRCRLDPQAGALAAGNLALRRGDTAGALEAFRRAIHVSPRSAIGFSRLGDALFEAQRYEEAERAYRSALAQDAHCLSAQRALGLLDVRRGRIVAAEVTFFELNQRAPRDADAALALGMLRLARADLPTAQAAFTRALSLRPRDAAATYGLGRVALRRGDLVAAETRFRALGTRFGHLPYGPYGLALVAARRGDEEEACAELERARARGLNDTRAVALDREAEPLRATRCYAEFVRAQQQARAG